MSSSSSSLEPANITPGGSSSSSGPAPYGSSSSFAEIPQIAPSSSSSKPASTYASSVQGSSSSSFASVNTPTGIQSAGPLNVQALQSNADTLKTFTTTQMDTFLAGVTKTDQANLTVLNQKLAEFRTFNNNLRSTITALTKDIDIGRRTQQLGELRERIKKLEKLEATAREEADTAESRLQYVEKREQDVSYKQLFFLDRPVREFSVPTFVTLSVLFAFLAIRFIYMIYAGVQVGAVNSSFLTGFGAQVATTGLFGFGAQAPTAGLAGLFSTSGITGQLR
jgi:hypothetical protein